MSRNANLRAVRAAMRRRASSPVSILKPDLTFDAKLTLMSSKENNRPKWRFAQREWEVEALLGLRGFGLDVPVPVSFTLVDDGHVDFSVVIVDKGNDFVEAAFLNELMEKHENKLKKFLGYEEEKTLSDWGGKPGVFFKADDGSGIWFWPRKKKGQVIEGVIKLPEEREARGQFVPLNQAHRYIQSDDIPSHIRKMLLGGGK